MISPVEDTNKRHYLGNDFAPGEKDVIIGRGKVCYNHSGNRRLTEIATNLLSAYSAEESTKKSRSELINRVVEEIRSESPEGGFVRFDADSNLFFIVPERMAREKVSQTFRDALNDRYKSSATSKILKRREERIAAKKKHKKTSDEISDALLEHRARVDSLLQASTSRYRFGSPSGPSMASLPGTSLLTQNSFPRQKSFSILDTTRNASPLPRQISYESAVEASHMERNPPYAALKMSPFLRQRSVSDGGISGLPPPPLARSSALERLRSIQISRELDRKAEEYMLLSSLYKNGS